MRVLYLTTAAVSETSPEGRLGALPLVLRSAGLDVVCVDRLGRLPLGMARGTQKLARIAHRRVALDRCGPLLQFYASAVESAQRRCRANAILVGETPLVAYASSTVPIVSWTDAVFGGMIGYYPEFTGLSAGSVRRGHDAERRALQRVTAAVFLSEWAAEGAFSFYNVPPEKVRVVPFGGVPVSLPTTQEIEQSIRERAADRELRLIWVGRDWSRKGGQVAVETAEILRARGHETRLTIIGVTPPARVSRLPWVEDQGLLDRSSARDRDRLAATFLSSHVHLLPTRAECMGLGLAEASAYGVPSVAASTGGTSSTVTDGKTGFLVPAGAGAERYAHAVERLVASPEGFVRFARQAREDYVDRLSYPVIGGKIRELLEGLIKADRPA